MEFQMAKIAKLLESEWAGNKFPSITIITDDPSDYDPELFKKIFNFLKETYLKEMDKNANICSVFDVPVDRYFSDFQIADCSVMMNMDGFIFSIGFSKKKIRDKVIAKLKEKFL